MAPRVLPVSRSEIRRESVARSAADSRSMDADRSNAKQHAKHLSRLHADAHNDTSMLSSDPLANLASALLRLILRTPDQQVFARAHGDTTIREREDVAHGLAVRAAQNG